MIKPGIKKYELIPGRTIALVFVITGRMALVILLPTSTCSCVAVWIDKKVLTILTQREPTCLKSEPVCTSKRMFEKYGELILIPPSPPSNKSEASLILPLFKGDKRGIKGGKYNGKSPLNKSEASLILPLFKGDKRGIKGGCAGDQELLKQPLNAQTTAKQIHPQLL